MARLCDRGYAERIVLSHDAMCFVDWFPRSMSEAAKDWRWTHIPEDVLPAMRASGISDADIDDDDGDQSSRRSSRAALRTSRSSTTTTP